MPSLDTYLARMAAVSFRYGVCDCVKFVCGWLVESGHPDPSPVFGDYDDRRAEDLLTAYGGLLNLAQTGFAALPETAEPKRGDIGVIYLKGGKVPALAICTGTKWAMKSAARGVVVHPAQCLKAWSV